MTSKETILAAMCGLGKADATDLRIRMPHMTDTEIIDEEEKIPQYSNDKDYTAYDPNTFCVRDENQVWVLLQPYNAAHYPNTRPSELRALWGLKHTTNSKKAKPYVVPYGTSGLYMKGECYKDEDGNVWISNIDNNAYTAADFPAGWHQWEGDE